MDVVDSYFRTHHHKTNRKKQIQKNQLYDEYEAAKNDYYGFLRSHRGDGTLEQIDGAYQRFIAEKRRLYWRCNQLGIWFPNVITDYERINKIDEVYHNHSIIVLIDGDQIHRLDELFALNDIGIIVFANINSISYFESQYVHIKDQFVRIEVKDVKEAADVAIEAVLKRFIIKHGVADKKFVIVSNDKGFNKCIEYISKYYDIPLSRVSKEVNIEDALKEINRWKKLKAQ